MFVNVGGSIVGIDPCQIHDEVSLLDEYMRALSKGRSFRTATSLMVKMYRSLNVDGVRISQS